MRWPPCRFCPPRSPSSPTPPKQSCIIPALIVYAVIDDALSPDFPLGDALEASRGRRALHRGGTRRRSRDGSEAAYRGARAGGRRAELAMSEAPRSR
jgi:hypothetical protein